MRCQSGLRVCLSALAVGLLLAGCHGGSPHSQAPPPTKADEGAQFLRGTQRQVAQNDLVQLALFYKQYDTEYGQGPKVEELKAYIQRDAPKIVQGIQAGRYVVVPGVTQGSGKVVAYEKDADLNGNRLVAMEDGSVHLMPEAEFQAALKNNLARQSTKSGRESTML